MSSTDPRLLIVGPGALGGLFAARLGRRWSGTHVLDHRADRADRLQDRGLHVTGVTMADWTPPPGRIRAEVRGWPVMDAVFFFVKAPALPAALKAAASLIKPATSLVVFPECAAAAALVPRRRQVVSALTEERARLDGVNSIIHEAAGPTFLDGPAPAVKLLAAWLQTAGISSAVDKKLGDRIWSTLLAQACVDVPTALTDTPQKSLLVPPLQELGDELLEECVAIAKAAKRPVTSMVLRRRRDELISKAPDAKSPLGKDLLRGRPTERAALLDPLLAAAKKGKVPAPLLTAMDRLLRRLEKEGAAA